MRSGKLLEESLREADPLRGLAAPRIDRRDGLDLRQHVVARDELAERDVIPVEVLLPPKADEELRALRIAEHGRLLEEAVAAHLLEAALDRGRVAQVHAGDAHGRARARVDELREDGRARVLSRRRLLRGELLDLRERKLHEARDRIAAARHRER